jgi:hypothetical protein
MCYHIIGLLAKNWCNTPYKGKGVIVHYSPANLLSVYCNALYVISMVIIEYFRQGPAG